MSYVVHVHVGDKIVAVACGNATQRVKWLANVGVARFDELKFQVTVAAAEFIASLQL